MKLEKKHYIIIGVVVAIIAIWYFFLRKKKAPAAVAAPKPESGYAGIYGNFGNESGFTIQKEVRVPQQQQTAKCPEGQSWGKVGSYDIWEDGPPVKHTSVAIMGCVGVGSGGRLPATSAYFTAPKTKRSGPLAKMHCYKTVGGVTTEIDCSTLPKTVKDVLTKA